ncbi:hypothetical protein [Inquilinus sp. Marseille-Q2685]|uniref:hypothetical protein n=1 Tax=Inquilinus sp. Marseille-Q2685 TaxID=2866581 RepID=UPI001CE435A3|nr:hypothetical protein [Inquilinus sp. Marseille-Q2685]
MDKPRSVSPQPAAAPGLNQADAEQAARMLDRLAEMAMEQAEAMHRATMAAVQADDAARAKEYGLAFDRAGRAVRHMLALKLHLARKRQEMAEKAAAHARDSAAAKETRRFRVARAVACSVAANRDLDAETCEAQIAAMWRRLVDDPGIDADLSLSGHALEEIVFHLCRDMGIRPDPAWIDPDYSGADWFGRRRKPKDGEDKPPAPWWPEEGPDTARYWHLDESDKVPVQGWYDIETGERLDRAPWLLKPGGG